ncbi:Tripartite tricarboxylate transporter family receptor [Variovorax sp. PBL-H6]|nr:Tripartite tricarboxylate transporter family receptor [Variovorax sp. PBL-H6]
MGKSLNQTVFVNNRAGASGIIGAQDVKRSQPDGAKDVKQLVAMAKLQPNQIDYASGGVGITVHLGMELLQVRTGIRLNHIPHNGSPAGLNVVIGGQTTLMMYSGAAALPHVKSGRLWLLATTGAQRAVALPDLPTLAEQGVPGYEVTGWNGVVVPKRTPRAIIDRLNDSLRDASKDPTVVTS